MLTITMWHRHLHTDTARAVADFLNDRHNLQLTDEDLTQALTKLGLKLVTNERTDSADQHDVDATKDGMVCMDGPDGCIGQLTTVTDSRHIRCERHWSVFYESTGM
jgi:hypothetical protein